MDAPNETPTAAILVIGNEILSGRTQDTNLHWIAGRLTALGIRLREARVVSDVEGEIVAAVRALSERYSYVFTTGGIGPTHDDITAESIAKAFDKAVVIDPDAAARMARHYGGAEHLTPTRLRMARIPEGASLIENAVSGAPGFRIGNVFVMAGVPTVMRAMFESFAGGLTGGPEIRQRSVTCNVPESTLADALGALQARHPTVDLGSYPWFRQGVSGVSLVARGTEPALLDTVVGEIAQMIRDLGGEPRIDA